MALTSKERSYLRGQAQKMDPIFQIGKGGITDEIVLQVRNAIIARELIKLKVLETCPLNAKEACIELSEKIGCEQVLTIGSKFVLFLKKDKESAYKI